MLSFALTFSFTSVIYNNQRFFFDNIFIKATSLEKKWFIFFFHTSKIEFGKIESEKKVADNDTSDNCLYILLSKQRNIIFEQGCWQKSDEARQKFEKNYFLSNFLFLPHRIKSSPISLTSFRKQKVLIHSVISHFKLFQTSPLSSFVQVSRN